MTSHLGKMMLMFAQLSPSAKAVLVCAVLSILFVGLAKAFGIGGVFALTLAGAGYLVVMAIRDDRAEVADRRRRQLRH